jgi:predicted acetyltransferase
LDGELTVEEIFYEDGETLKALLLALTKAARSTDCAVLRCELPRGEFPHHFFSDSRRRAYLEPHGMFRIIDVPSLVSGLKTAVEGSFCVKVEDGLCEWNDGAFTITCKGGQMAAKRGGIPDCRCDISTLSSLVCGSTDGITARAMGLFESDNPAALSAFPRRKACFFEHY